MSYHDLPDHTLSLAYKLLEAERNGVRVPFHIAPDLRAGLLAVFDLDSEAHSEMIAETGSSAFYGGANSGDAMSIARQVVGAPPSLTPLQKRAAELSREIGDLTVWLADELPGLSYLSRIPEYPPRRDTYRPNADGTVTLVTPAGGQHTYDPADLHDDIPF